MSEVCAGSPAKSGEPSSRPEPSSGIFAKLLGQFFIVKLIKLQYM